MLLCDDARVAYVVGNKRIAAYNVLCGRTCSWKFSAHVLLSDASFSLSICSHNRWYFERTADSTIHAWLNL